MTKIINPIIIQKDTAPYLYLTDFSGIYINKYLSSQYNRGIYIDVNEQESETLSLVSFQMWFRYPNTSFNSQLKLFSIQNENETIDFICSPILEGRKARVTTSEPSQLHKNGNLCSSFIIYPEEWTSLYAIFNNPISFNSFKGKIILHPGFVFNNISQYVYENEISSITTYSYLSWQKVLNPSIPVINTWQDISETGTWIDAGTSGSVQNNFILSGDYIYGNQTGTSVIVNDDLSTVRTYANGVDLFTNVEWQKIEKTLV